MKKHLIIGIATLLITVPALVMAGSYFTEGKLNGRYWNKLTNSDKSTYITGITDGIILCAEVELSYMKSNINKEERYNIIQDIASYMPQEGNIKEAIKYIDDFYSDPSNSDVPVPTAYLRIITKHKNAENN